MDAVREEHDGGYFESIQFTQRVLDRVARLPMTVSRPSGPRGGSGGGLCPRPAAVSSRRRRGSSCPAAALDGRHQRSSIRRICAPGRRTLRRRRTPDFETCSAPFGGPRGGAGARGTRAPGRPRWVKTRFGPRRAAGGGGPFGVDQGIFPRRPARASTPADRWPEPIARALLSCCEWGSRRAWP